MVAHSWVDRALYPFEPYWFDADRWKMHYIDTGQGEPVVFLHGSPGWSFQYRETIKQLKVGSRCIALDNLGFGLSDKPSGVTYRPERQAEYFEQFVKGLGLQNITLVVHGFGGPIGLSYAIKHPENVRHVVLMNTWLWPVRGNPKVDKMLKFVNGGLGRYLILKHNFIVRAIHPMLLKDRSKYTRLVKKHYVMPFADRQHRAAPHDYVRALAGSSNWLESLWQQRDVLRNIPALFLWGMKDDYFGKAALSKWDGVFAEAEVHRLPNTGHFVPEEHGADIVAYIDPFLKDLSSWTNQGVVI